MGFFTSAYVLDPVNDLKDLTGHVAIVTGGNAGIGLWTVIHLSRKGAKVYLAARSEAKANDAIKKIKAIGPTKGDIVYLNVVLNDLESVRAAAARVIELETRLDIIVNNAADIQPSPEINKQGVSVGFTTNHLGPFALVKLLTPLLEKTAALPGSDVRVISLSSSTHSMASDVKFKTLADINQSWEPAKLAPLKRYGFSKLANILHTRELQKRWDAAGIPILAICLHPGLVVTDGHNASILSFPGGSLLLKLDKFISVQPEQGAYNTLFAAASPAVKADPKKYAAKYLLPVGKIGPISPHGTNDQHAADLWAISEKVLKENYNIF